MYSGAQRLPLDGEERVPLREIADQWIDLLIQASEYGIVDPGLLNKLELTLDITIEADEMKTAFFPIIHQRIGQAGPVGASSTQYTVTVRRI